MKKLFIIQWIILVMIVIVVAAIILALVIILSPALQEQYPYARESILSISTAGMVLGTLILALGTFNLIWENSKQEDKRNKRKLANDIINWCTDVTEYCATYSGGCNTEEERWLANKEYNTLKHEGKKLITLSKSEVFISKSLLDLLDNTILFFEPMAWKIIVEVDNRKKLNTLCDSINEKATNLLTK